MNEPNIKDYIYSELSLKEQEIDLRNQVYKAMSERAKLSTYEYIQYIKKENTNDKHNDSGEL